MKKLPFSLFKRLSESNLEQKEKHDEIDRLILSTEPVSNERPTQLLYYTRTSGGEVKPNDTKGLKSLSISVNNGKRQKQKNSTKVIGSDLTKGYDSFKKTSNSEIYQLDGLFAALKYHLQNSKDKQTNLDKLRSSVISLRRNMLMLMQIPMYPWKECRFNIIFWKGIIIIDFDWEYFEEDISTRMSKMSLSHRNNTDLLMYTGFKFEELITKDSEGTGDFYTLVEQEFDKFNTIITAEIDASIDSKPDLSSYVELKTHSQTKSQMDFKLASKLMSSWCQTKLVNGKYVVVGFRSKGYNLASVKKYETNEITNLLNLHSLRLSDNTTITSRKLVRWYHCILKWLVELVRDNVNTEEFQVFKMHYLPEQPVEESSLSLLDVDGSSATSIFNDTIPPWFQEYFNEYSK